MFVTLRKYLDKIRLSALFLLSRSLFSVGRGSGLRADLVRGGLGVGGLRLFSLPLSLAISVLLARTLGPEGFGQYAFITSVIMVISLPLDQGIRQLITREVANYCHEGNWGLFRGLLWSAHKWVLLTATLIAVILGGISVLNATWCLDDRWTLLLVALLILPFLGLSALRGATLRGLGHVVQANVPELLVRPGLHLLIVSTLIIFDYLNPATAIMSNTFATVVAFAIGAVLVQRYLPSESRTVRPEYRNSEWAKAWLPFTLLVAAAMLNYQIGVLLLGLFGTDEQVATLRVAEQGAQLVALSLGIVNLVIAPHVARFYREGNNTGLQKLSRQSARAALCVGVPVALPLLVFGPQIINIVFGAAYVSKVPAPLVIIVVAQLFNIAFGPVGMFLMMCGFEKKTVSSHVFALACNGLLCTLLIPLFGVVGASFSFAISLILLNVLLSIHVVRHIGIRPGII